MMLPQWVRSLDTPRRLALFAGLASFLVLALTAPGMPIVWDEGEYLWRSDRVAEWFRLIARLGSEQGGWRAFSPSTIHEYWHFINWDEGHPGWGAVPVALTTMLFKGVLHPLTAARLGSIAVFSGACAAVAYRIRSAYGAAGALVAVAALLTFPRLFAEAHFATLDGQLTAWWLMLWAVDAAGRSGPSAFIPTGVLAGLTAATKFTGWLAWPPLVASRFLRGSWRRWMELPAVILVALATFYFVNPPLWHHPIAGTTTHYQLNLQRTLNVPITFLGRTYDLHHPLPWYNTIVWLLVVTPAPLLVLGAVGVVHAIRRREAVALSLVFHWATLMIVRAIPVAPPHDGIRLFLPAFAFWCVLAGTGAHQVWNAAVATPARSRRFIVRAAVVAGIGAGAVNVARYYPQTLSHYNLLVGGVRGAAALGMEPTYWWDSLDRDVLAWLNAHTARGERVAFSSIANVSMIRGWGWLVPEQADRRGVFKWYVFQNRTSFLADSDRWLMKTTTPAFVKYAGRHDPGRVPADLDVPLLLIYSFDSYRAALAATAPAAR